MNPFDNFDQIYYINLDKRPDRKQSMLTEFAKMNIKLDKVTRMPGIVHNFPPIGCSTAQLKCLLDCKEKGYKNCIIFEDDFVFKHNKETTYSILQNFFHKGIHWDVLMFSCFMMV